MKGNLTKLLFGIALLLCGVLLTLKAMGVLDTISFDGWWTLFIIIPCLSSIIAYGFRAVPTGGLLVGLYFLADAQNWLPVDFHHYFWPGLIVIVGLWMILTSFYRTSWHHHQEQSFSAGQEGSAQYKSSHESYGHPFRNASQDNSEWPQYSVVFSGNEVVNHSPNLRGGELTAIFGGLDVDFSPAQLQGNAIINVTAIFGGVDIRVPQNVNVVVQSTPIFGGCDNNVRRANIPGQPTLTIRATCIFGGSDVNP